MMPPLSEERPRQQIERGRGVKQRQPIAGRESRGGKSPITMPPGESGLGQVCRAMHPEQRGTARDRLVSERWQRTEIAGCYLAFCDRLPCRGSREDESPGFTVVA